MSCGSWFSTNMRFAQFIFFIIFYSNHLLAESPKEFIELLKKPDSITIELLKPYYKRSKAIPRRLQRNLKSTDAITALGKKLFFEPRLSASGKMSCATCHNPNRGWTDGKGRSVEANRRRSMSLYNLAWDSQFTWNGQAGSLMSQAILALTAKGGMSTHFEVLPTGLGKDKKYQDLFLSAFQDQIPRAHLVSGDTIAVALEYYVSTIISPETSFDRWIQGEESAISKNAKSGFLIFNTKGQCAFCHNTWRFSDGNVYDTGLSEEAAWSKGKAKDYPDFFAFKAVGLRNISKRAPYMHDGSLKALLEVVDFYNRGGNIERSSKSKHITKLELSNQERKNLLEFLKTL